MSLVGLHLVAGPLSDVGPGPGPPAGGGTAGPPPAPPGKLQDLPAHIVDLGT